MVFRVPRSREALTTIPELQDGIVRHSGDELLALIAAAGIEDPPPPMPRRERPDPVFTARVRRLGEIVQQTATELDLAPEVLATRRDLEQVARDEPEAAVWQGWRREVIGARLKAAT